MCVYDCVCVLRPILKFHWNDKSMIAIGKRGSRPLNDRGGVVKILTVKRKSQSCKHNAIQSHWNQKFPAISVD